MVIAAACTAATGLALARGFVAAWNRHDVPAAVRLWAPEPAFQWLSGPGRLGPRAYDRSTVAAYVRRPHGRLRVVTLAAGYDAGRDIVDFAGKISIDGRAPKDFKGAAACSTTRPLLIVWSM